MPARPPELRAGDFDFQVRGCTGGDRDDLVVQRQGHVIRDPAPGRGPGEFRGEGEGDAAAGGVSLGDAGGGEAVAGPGFEAEVAPEAGGDEARAPVPAELAGLFAQHGGAAEGVVEFLRLVLRAEPGHGPGGAGEMEAELVAAGAQPAADREAQRHKHVVRAGNLTAVEINRGERVEPVADELHFLGGEQGGGDAESRAVFPVMLLDPLEAKFVGAVKRIGNQAVAEQVAVDAAGHSRGPPARRHGGVTKLPGGGRERKDRHGIIPGFRRGRASGGRPRSGRPQWE
jgi:hypothetical protein